MNGVIASQCQTLGCIAMAVGGVEDHVHALVSVHPSVPVAHVARAMKAPSSGFLKRVLGLPAFAWQEGYGAFSVDPRGSDEVRHYVLNQARHHAQRTLVDVWEITELSPDPHCEPRQGRPRFQPE